MKDLCSRITRNNFNKKSIQVDCLDFSMEGKQGATKDAHGFKSISSTFGELREILSQVKITFDWITVQKLMRDWYFSHVLNISSFVLDQSCSRFLIFIGSLEIRLLVSCVLQLFVFYLLLFAFVYNLFPSLIFFTFFELNY